MGGGAPRDAVWDERNFFWSPGKLACPNGPKPFWFLVADVATTETGGANGEFDGRPALASRHPWFLLRAGPGRVTVT